MEQKKFKANFFKVLKKFLNLYPYSFLKQFNPNFQEVYFLILQTTCKKRIKNKNIKNTMTNISKKSIIFIYLDLKIVKKKRKLVFYKLFKIY